MWCNATIVCNGNVEQIKKSLVLGDIIQKFKESKYGLSSVILDASYCSVPRARTRFFLIGHYGDKHNQLNVIYKNKLSNFPMTIKDYLGNKLGIEYYYRHPKIIIDVVFFPSMNLAQLSGALIVPFHQDTNSIYAILQELI